MIPDQIRQREDMITRYRVVQWRWAWRMAQDYIRGEAINERDIRGGWNGPSDLLTAEINQGMMAEGNFIPESYRRRTQSKPRRHDEVRELIYTQTGMNDQVVSYFLFWGDADIAPERHQLKVIASGNQRSPCTISAGIMEARQKARGTEEQHNFAVENKSRKGKGIIREDQPSKIWDIEDGSEEELPRDERKVRSFSQDRLAGDKNQQEENDYPAPQERKVRRYDMRKRERSPGRGADLNKKRGRGQKRRMQEEGENSRKDTRPVRKTRRTVDHRVRRAERAYQSNTNPAVRRIIRHLEEETLQEQSEDEMEEWELLLHDPGHTRGRMSLFKQSLHIYWVIKGLLAKALEQVAREMIELSQGNPDMRRELSFIRIAMERQEEKLDVIHQLLKGNHQDAEKGASQ